MVTAGTSLVRHVCVVGMQKGCAGNTALELSRTAERTAEGPTNSNILREGWDSVGNRSVGHMLHGCFRVIDAVSLGR